MKRKYLLLITLGLIISLSLAGVVVWKFRARERITVPLRLVIGDPTPRELSVAKGFLKDFMKQPRYISLLTPYKGARLGDVIPIYNSGVGLRSIPIHVHRNMPMASYLAPLISKGKIVAVVKVSGDRLEVLSPFKFWQKEAQDVARPIAQKRGLEIGEAYFVTLGYDKFVLKFKEGDKYATGLGTQGLRVEKFWDIPLLRDKTIVGVVRVDPWSGESRLLNFPIPCKMGEKITPEEAVAAGEAYLKDLDFWKTHPDIIKPKRPGYTDFLHKYNVTFSSDTNVSHLIDERLKKKIGMEKIRGSKITLEISEYGELLGYIERDPFIISEPIG